MNSRESDTSDNPPIPIVGCRVRMASDPPRTFVNIDLENCR